MIASRFHGVLFTPAAVQAIGTEMISVELWTRVNLTTVIAVVLAFARNGLNGGKCLLRYPLAYRLALPATWLGAQCGQYHNFFFDGAKLRLLAVGARIWV